MMSCMEVQTRSKKTKQQEEEEDKKQKNFKKNSAVIFNDGKSKLYQNQ